MKKNPPQTTSNTQTKGQNCISKQKCSNVFLMLLTAVFLFVTTGVFAVSTTPVPAKYIRIEMGNGYKDFSEVEVFVDGKNVAKGKPATSSDQYSADNGPDKGVDGITGLDDFQNFFSTSGAETPHWWEVDLGSEMNIDKIIIYTRKYDEEIQSRLDGASLVLKDANGNESYSTTIDASGGPLAIPITIYTAPADFNKPVIDRIAEMSMGIYTIPTMNEWVPTGDMAKVMPVGNTDATATLRYSDKYEIHLAKQDFVGVTHDLNSVEWSPKSLSPGHISLDFGVNRDDISDFEQKLDFSRGSVTLNLTTPQGTISAETYGVMDGSAIVMAVHDTRATKNVTLKYNNWRPLNDNLAPLTINASNNKIDVKEVHKYDTYAFNGSGYDYSDSGNHAPDNILWNLGVNTQIAFASDSGIISSTTAVNGGDATLTPQGLGNDYYIVISCGTSYDGNPDVSAAFNSVVSKNKTSLLNEQISWWNNFWQNSYIDLYGDNTEEIMKSWLLGYYTFAILSKNPLPWGFNGGAFTIDKDRTSWSAAYYFQNIRELIWPTCGGNKPQWAKKYLKYMDGYFSQAKNFAAQIQKLGARQIEAPLALKPGLNPVKNVSTFDANALATARANDGVENIGGFDANARSLAQAAELTQMMFDYVAYAGDTSFLQESAIPWLKEATLFYLSSMKQDGNGQWHMNKSDAVETLKMVKDPATDMAAARYLYSMVIAHGSEFGYEQAFIDEVQATYNNLAPLPTGHWYCGDVSQGDWSATLDTSVNAYSQALGPGPGFDNKFHNNENPELYSVFPFTLVDANSPQADYDRAVNTFNIREWPNYWGWAPGGIWAARLKLDSTFKVINQHIASWRKFSAGYSNCAVLLITPDPNEGRVGETLSGNTATNLQLDSMAIDMTSPQEALLQSHQLTSTTPSSLTNGGIIEVAPAVPAAVSGRFKLMARGGFVVSAEFRENKAFEIVTVESNRGEHLQIKNPYPACFITKNGSNFMSNVSDSVISFDTSAGDVYVFTETEQEAAPAIAVEGNGKSISNGSTTPSVADDTDFGTVSTGSGTIVKTFTIKNTGTQDLTVSGVTITGANASDFTVTSTPDGTVAPNTSTTFSITFDPSADGIRSATVQIASNDPNKGTFTYAIQGNGSNGQTYSISGTISGDVQQGVTVTAGGLSGVSDASGNYTISGLSDGTYTVVPSLSGYSFSPANQSVTINGANVTGKNFTATTSGGGGGGVDKPTDITGCNLWLDAADPKGDGSAPTGKIDGWVNKADSANVAYQINPDNQPSIVPNGLNGLSILNFEDGYQGYPIVDASAVDTQVKITASTIFWVVKENATLENDGAPFFLGDSDGTPFHRGIDPALNYAFDGKMWDDEYSSEDVRNGQTYLDGAAIDGTTTVFPTDDYHIVSLVLAGPVQFDQVTQDRYAMGARSWQGGIAEIISYSSALSDADRQSVEAYLQEKWFGIAPPPAGDYSISGKITDSNGTGIAGVTVAIDAAHSGVTDANGNYTISGVTDGTYTLTPTKNGYTFNPVTTTVIVAGGDVSTGTEFTATSSQPGENSITGQITDNDGKGIAGVTVTAGNYTSTTDANGNFTITGVADGAYNVMPTKDGYTFSPVAVPVSTSDGSGSNLTFTGVEGVLPGIVNPPVAVADSYFVQQGSSLNVSEDSGVLANDVNLESTEMTAVLDSTVTHGTLSLNTDGSFTYTTNNTNFTGDDTFTYHAFNENANSETVTVTISIIANGSNVPATAVGDSYDAVQNTPLTVSEDNSVLVNDLNANGATITLVSAPTIGQLTLNPDGTFTYEPKEDFAGHVTFTYAIDGTSPQSSAIVSINVAPVKITVGSLLTFTAAQVEDLDGKEFAKAPKLYGVFSNGKKGSLKKIKESTPSEFSGAWGKRFTLYDKKALKGGYASYFEDHGASIPEVIMIKAKGKTVDKAKIDGDIYHVQLVPPVITAITDSKGNVITTADAGETITIKGKYFGDKAPKVALEVDGKLLKCKVDKTGMTDYTNYKGKPSSMDPVTGESSVTVILPPSKKLDDGQYPIVLDNKIGIATTSEIEEEGQLPEIIIGDGE